MVYTSNLLITKNKFYWHFVYWFRHGLNRGILFHFPVVVIFFIKDFKCFLSTISNAEKKIRYVTDKERLGLNVVRESCLFITWSCCILKYLEKTQSFKHYQLQTIIWLKTGCCIVCVPCSYAEIYNKSTICVQEYTFILISYSYPVCPISERIGWYCAKAYCYIAFIFPN